MSLEFTFVANEFILEDERAGQSVALASKVVRNLTSVA